MNNAGNIVIFGAGKIGRSFIGQLFGRAGFEVVFIDVDDHLVALLNEKAGYKVVIKAEKEQVFHINGVRAIHGTQRVKVIQAITDADIMAVSVGKNALEKILPVIAEGLLVRFRAKPNKPLDIILAENMRSAAEFCYHKLHTILPEGFPLDESVGLVETSIGKMVPLMTTADLEEDPLQVFAEPYNTLILDRRGFKGPVPEVPGLAPKDNIQAWVDRKAFIHNMGHAAAAYYGNFFHPGAEYMYEILADANVMRFTRTAMLQSADILLKTYPHDYSKDDLIDHIDDLLYRFRNKALKDTIFRVGHDLKRKLGADDRFMGIIRLGQSAGKPFEKILTAMVYGFFFKAADEEGSRFTGDIELEHEVAVNMDAVLEEVCGIDLSSEASLAAAVKSNYAALNSINKP